MAFRSKVMLTLIFIIAVGSLLLSTQDSGFRQYFSYKENSIEGVWEYLEDDVLPEVKGMSFFTENHFAFVLNYGASGKKTLTHSGTYVIEDSIVTARIKHSHNQALIGQNIRWVHKLNDRVASYKILDKTGKIVERGKIKRLE